MRAVMSRRHLPSRWRTPNVVCKSLPAVFALVLGSGPAASPGPAAAPRLRVTPLVVVASWASQAFDITYDKFMALPPEARRDRFRSLSPEGKALIMRTHAERWRDRHLDQLSAAQRQLVQEVIAFITPALYRETPDPELERRRRDLEARLKCRFWRSDVLELLGRERKDALPVRWLDDFAAWLQDCIIR